ncbi:MAG: hypothetical protein HC892_09815 [Saprospiraceae bacterium]|nr:hypothetical protein [Saprospiraceae bacterium]
MYGKVAEGENSWIYKKLDSSTAYLKFGTFAFWNSDFNWKNFIDSSFALINKQQFQNLVIDLRGNEGGSGEIRDYILSMLTDKPLQNERNSINCYRYLVIPDSLNQYLSTWDRSFRQPKNADNYILNEIGLYQNKIQVDDHPILPSKNNFKGNTYLLVDAVCSSATFGLAWTFQYNRLGKIIGEPTGGTKQGLNGSEMFFFTMPSSNIEIDIPLIYFYTKNVKDEGVIPDVIIKLKQKDVYDNIDPVLDYVLKSVNLK